MRSVVLKLLGIALARHTDHEPEMPIRPCLDSRDGILDDDRTYRLDSQ